MIINVSLIQKFAFKIFCDPKYLIIQNICSSNTTAWTFPIVRLWWCFLSGGQGRKWEDWLLWVQQTMGGYQGGGRGQIFWFYKSATAQQLYTFNKKEEQEIREEFFKLDTDQSGFITKGEFSNLNVWYSEMIESVCAQVESYSGLTRWRFIEKWYCGEVSSMLVLSLKVISWVSQTFQRRCWLFSLVVNTSMEIRCVNSRQQSNYNLELNQLYKILLDQWRWL